MHRQSTVSNTSHYSQSALAEMNKVSEHINAMKKKYEESDVKIQELQNLIRGTEV